MIQLIIGPFLSSFQSSSNSLSLLLELLLSSNLDCNRSGDKKVTKTEYINKYKSNGI